MNVTRVDLIERAEPPSIQRAAPVEPVGRIGAREHGVGDRREASGGLSVNQRVQRDSTARGHCHGRRHEAASVGSRQRARVARSAAFGPAGCSVWLTVSLARTGRASVARAHPLSGT